MDFNIAIFLVIQTPGFPEIFSFQTQEVYV